MYRVITPDGTYTARDLEIALMIASAYDLRVIIEAHPARVPGAGACA